MKSYKVSIVGATGAVGVELVSVLHRRDFPVASLRLFASARSAGKVVETPFGSLTMEEFSVEGARESDFCFLAVSGTFAKDHAEAIAEGDGPVVIDNSSAFRLEPNVPLVVPEINPHTLIGAKLIANPNCTTAVAAVALWPLHKAFGLRKALVATYQAASGAGAEGVEELRSGTATYLEGGSVTSSVFQHPLPFNVIPHIDKFQENLYTKEEMKVTLETRKIMGLDEDVAISCTAVRIPIMRAHSEVIVIETHRECDADTARALLRSAPGVRLVDDPSKCEYPMPLTSTSSLDVEAGRVRRSLVYGAHGLEFFVSGDQLLRGAALNAVLIAEVLVKGDIPAAVEGYTGPRRAQGGGGCFASVAGLALQAAALAAAAAVGAMLAHAYVARSK